MDGSTHSNTVVQLGPHAVPDAFSAVLPAVPVAVLFAWRLPLISLVLAGGLIEILARSRWIQRVREPA